MCKWTETSSLSIRVCMSHSVTSATMSLLRIFHNRCVRRYSSNPYPFHSLFSNHTGCPAPIPPPPPTSSQLSSQPLFPATPFAPQASHGFSSTEETPPPSDVNNSDRLRCPDTTSTLVGPPYILHARVRSLIGAGDLEGSSYVARLSVFQKIGPSVFTCNAIIGAMYRSKRYDDAKALFCYFFRQFNIIPNIDSYNHLIGSHCLSNEIEKAMEVYKEVLELTPLSPSPVTYRHLTKGLVDVGRIDDAVSLLREMVHEGHGADSLVYNNVILGFLNLGNLDKANELFDELKKRCTVYDGVVNATFMDWFFNQGRVEEAMECYRDLMVREYWMVLLRWRLHAAEAAGRSPE